MTVASEHDDAAALVLVSDSLAHTIRIGQALGSRCEGGETVALRGELGSGKTVLVRGIAMGLGIPPDLVTSPTFVFLQEYIGRVRLIHGDLYRLESSRDIAQLGLDEYFDNTTVVVLEWADRAEAHLPADHVRIELAHQSPDTRRITMAGTGPRSSSLLNATGSALGAHRHQNTDP